MKNVKLMFGWIVVFLFFTNCIKENEFEVLKGDYLGQRPPGREAQLFAPGIVSTGLNDRDVTIRPI
jgi:hypothetical protein